jgi:hypothetical protein
VYTILYYRVTRMARPCAGPVVMLPLLLLTEKRLGFDPPAKRARVLVVIYPVQYLIYIPDLSSKVRLVIILKYCDSYSFFFFSFFLFARTIERFLLPTSGATPR